MNSLRLEADEAHSKVEELKNKVKSLEQENLAKEQEITSLTHRNQLLEAEIEKLETGIKEAKDSASQSAQHDTQNEALQRRLQLLEEEAEEADKNLRETNEKYVYSSHASTSITPPGINEVRAGCVKPMSRRVTTNARCRLWRLPGTSGRASTKRCRRSMRSYRKSCTTSRCPSATSRKAYLYIAISGLEDAGCSLPIKPPSDSGSSPFPSL